MIDRRELLQGCAMAPLLAACPGAVAGVTRLLEEPDPSFRLDSMKSLVDERFRARSAETSIELQLVKVEERVGKIPEPALEQFFAVFRSSARDLPEGVYEVKGIASAGSFSGPVYLSPSSAVEGGEGYYYSTSFCNFRPA